MKNRQHFAFFVILSLVMLVLSGCKATESNSEKVGNVENPLVILEWTGFQATDFPQFYVPFTEKYTDLDKVVSYSFFGDDSEAFAKMSSGFEADLVHPCGSWFELYVDNGLVQPIDTSRLNDWNNIPEDLKAVGKFGNEYYFLPWDWGFESILVRTDLVDEVPTSWADLWDPKYAGKVAMYDSDEAGITTAAKVLGIDPYNATDEEKALITQKLIDVKSNLLTYWSDYTQVIELLASGDAWIVGNAWQDAYAYLKDDGYAVEYIDPSEGRFGYVCGFGISSDTENLDLIYEYLNAATDAKSMANFANEQWYGFSNLEAKPMVDDQVLDLLGIKEEFNIIGTTNFYQPISADTRKSFADIWNEVKSAP
jgi:spermidine/putrescine-binding protein